MAALSTHQALDAMLDWALANRSTKNEYVKCYTYPPGVIPQAIIEAKEALYESAAEDDHSIEGLEKAYQGALARVHELEAVIRQMRLQLRGALDLSDMVRK